MPLFTFDCAACGHTFDEICKILEPKPDALPCEKCSKPADRRKVYANPGVNLPNGAGQYIKG